MSMSIEYDVVFLPDTGCMYPQAQETCARRDLLAACGKYSTKNIGSVSPATGLRLNLYEFDDKNIDEAINSFTRFYRDLAKACAECKCNERIKIQH